MTNIMKIELEKSWLVVDTKVTEGWGICPNTINDGTIVRDSMTLFTTDGINFISASWCYTILFDETHAKMHAEANGKKTIEYAKKEIERYTKILNESN